MPKEQFAMTENQFPLQLGVWEALLAPPPPPPVGPEQSTGGVAGDEAPGNS